MNRYRTIVDPTIANSTHTIILGLVGPERDVLDVGCSSGFLAEALARRGCRVSGVELDEESASEAVPFLEQLVVGDLNRVDLVAAFGAARFDAIVFADVLEHLVDPADVLRRSLPLLRPGGAVVISVPNVAHGALRLALLQGRWRYTETGLLDETHLRFFTRDTLLRLLVDCGLCVTDVDATVLDPLGCEVEIDDENLPGTIVDWVRHQPESFVYQFVVRALVGNSQGVVPQTVPAVEVPVADDLHAERARQAHQDAADAAVLASEAEELRLRIEIVGHDYRNAIREIEQLRRSYSWRVGNALVWPFSKLRGVLGATKQSGDSGPRGRAPAKS